MKKINKQDTQLQQQQDLIAEIRLSGKSFIYDVEDELTDEFAHFYFLGFHDGKEVLFDTVLYTLRMQHESELFEMAEHKAAQHFPQYKKIPMKKPVPNMSNTCICSSAFTPKKLKKFPFTIWN